MTEFTLYCYQCIPFRMNIPKDKNSVMFKSEMEAWDKQVMENMENHQELLDKILTTDLVRHFESQKQSKKDKGKMDKCLAFFFNNKRYYFKVLLPKEGHQSNGIYMIRIANPRKTTREVDFVRMLQPDEPSALVIIDNRKD